MRNISSAQNPAVKDLILLQQKTRVRKQHQQFVAEGIREITAARVAGLQAQLIAVEAAFLESEEVQTLLQQHPTAEVLLMTTPIFAKCAYRSGVPNAVAIFPMRTPNLSELKLPENPLVLILDQIEKPGNLGAMLRTADAAGVHAVIVTDPLADIFNPNVIRNSLGSFFTQQLAVATTTDCLDWLAKVGVPVYVTHLEAAKPYWDVDLRNAAAIVMGTEATGVTDKWVRAATQNIIIPMQGVMDSLNVSNAAAIVLFEAVRQRLMGTF